MICTTIDLACQSSALGVCPQIQTGPCGFDRSWLARRKYEAIEAQFRNNLRTARDRRHGDRPDRFFQESVFYHNLVSTALLQIEDARSRFGSSLSYVGTRQNQAVEAIGYLIEFNNKDGK